MALGLFAIGVSGVISATFNSQITVSFVSWVGVLQGLGCGLLWIPLSLVTFATLRENLMADGTAFFHLIRNYGSSIFIALNVLVVLRTSKINNSELSEIANPYNERLSLPDAENSFNLNTTEGLLLLVEITDQAVMIGYLNSFILYALGALLPIPLTRTNSEKLTVSE